MSKKSPDKQLLDYTESDIIGIDIKNGNVCYHDSSKSGKNFIPTFCTFFLFYFVAILLNIYNPQGTVLSISQIRFSVFIKSTYSFSLIHIL